MFCNLVFPVFLERRHSSSNWPVSVHHDYHKNRAVVKWSDSTPARGSCNRSEGKSLALESTNKSESGYLVNIDDERALENILL
jgi:hypothetical protein